MERIIKGNFHSHSHRYLSDNHLTTIPQGVLDKMTYLNVLRLDANPLHCDCSLKWLYTYTKAKGVPVQFHAACQTPSHLYGRAFSTLEATDFKCSKYNPFFASTPLPVGRCAGKYSSTRFKSHPVTHHHLILSTSASQIARD